jgi:hypothetical protein
MRVALVSRITDIILRGAPDNVESSWQRELTESIGISPRERSSHGSTGRARDKSIKGR